MLIDSSITQCDMNFLLKLFILLPKPNFDFYRRQCNRHSNASILMFLINFNFSYMINFNLKWESGWYSNMHYMKI